MDRYYGFNKFSIFYLVKCKIFLSAPLIPATVTPVCYKAKNNQYASFTAPHKGRIKYIKLQHVSGGINCSTVTKGGIGLSNWGCLHTSYREDHILTVVTNTKDQIIFPIIENSTSTFKFRIPGAFHNDDELILTRDEPLTVHKNEEMRIWNTQDLYIKYEDDNTGTHCIFVFLKYC